MPEQPREEEAESLLKFRKRPEEQEEEKAAVVPPLPAREGSEPNFHWEITLTPTLLTTDTGMVELTTKIQKLLEEVVRGMLRDKGTAISNPVVTGYINLHLGCEQIKAIFRPQQVQMTPQQIMDLQRRARGMA